MAESPEAVAYDLLKIVAVGEKKNITGGAHDVDRKWILDTYAECLRAVKMPSQRD